MKEEFKRAQAWVEQHLHFDKAAGISMFETVIRILGGLLSAFELSKEQVLLHPDPDSSPNPHPHLSPSPLTSPSPSP